MDLVTELWCTHCSHTTPTLAPILAISTLLREYIGTLGFGLPSCYGSFSSPKREKMEWTLGPPAPQQHPFSMVSLTIFGHDL